MLSDFLVVLDTTRFLTLEDAYYDEKVRILIEKMSQQAHIMGEGYVFLFFFFSLFSMFIWGSLSLNFAFFFLGF